MASYLFNKAKESFLSQNPSIDLDTDTIKAAIINVATDNPSVSASTQYKSSVTSYSGTTDQTLQTKTVTNGLFDADDVTFSSVAISGSKTVGAVVLYKDTGTASTSPLIAYIDNFTAVTPNGGNITIAWDAGTNRIFQL